ncbi:hypothetical protein Tco_0891427 [Tanacetum coccineum]|uniref:Uncharacterized protein n=1 Tax=Tanacetum coccineum TaxID=301880 RepID=A0ABQ5C2W9_9ASTR
MSAGVASTGWVRMVTCVEASVLLGRKKGDIWNVQRLSRDSEIEKNSLRGVRVAREDDRGVSKGREDVREVFQQHGSGAKRKLSRCGRNQMGKSPILHLQKEQTDFVVYYDADSNDLEHT